MGVPPPPALPLRGRELAPISALALFGLRVADLGGAGLAHTLLLERFVGLRALDRGSGLLSRHSTFSLLGLGFGGKAPPNRRTLEAGADPEKNSFSGVG